MIGDRPSRAELFLGWSIFLPTDSTFANNINEQVIFFANIKEQVISLINPAPFADKTRHVAFSISMSYYLWCG